MKLVIENKRFEQFESESIQLEMVLACLLELPAARKCRILCAFGMSTIVFLLNLQRQMYVQNSSSFSAPKVLHTQRNVTRSFFVPLSSQTRYGLPAAPSICFRIVGRCPGASLPSAPIL